MNADSYGVIFVGHYSSGSARAGEGLRRVAKKIFPTTAFEIIWLVLNEPGSLNDAAAKLEETGCVGAAVQPLFMQNGDVYRRLVEGVMALNRPEFHMIVGSPLLQDCGDIPELINLAVALVPSDLPPDIAVLFLGHGHRHSDKIMLKFASLLQKRDHRFHLACLHGNPRLTDAINQMTASGYRRVLMQPLLFTAGTHLNRDFFGKHPTAWQFELESAGFECIPVRCGLLEIPVAARFCCERAMRLVASLTNGDK